MTVKKYTPLDPFQLGETVVIWVYLQIATEVLMALAYAFALTPDGGALTDDGFRSADMAVGLASILFLIVYVIGGFLGLKWIYRVNRNAHAFVRGLSNTPPWSVGWYFVPIASLWKPYEAMSEAWRASERPQRWRTAPKPGFLGWWWAAWLISSIVSNLSNVASRYTESVVDLAPLMIFGSMLSIAADVLFVRLVKGLSSLQRNQMTFGAFEGEPEPPEPVISSAPGRAPA